MRSMPLRTQNDSIDSISCQRLRRYFARTLRLSVSIQTTSSVSGSFAGIQPTRGRSRSRGSMMCIATRSCFAPTILAASRQPLPVCWKSLIRKTVARLFTPLRTVSNPLPRLVPRPSALYASRSRTMRRAWLFPSWAVQIAQGDRRRVPCPPCHHCAWR